MVTNDITSNIRDVVVFLLILFRAHGLPSSRLQIFLLLKRRLAREPVHIHVEKGENEAKFWVKPEVKLAYNDGYDARTLRELMEFVVNNKERIERAWNEFFG